MADVWIKYREKTSAGPGDWEYVKYYYGEKNPTYKQIESFMDDKEAEECPDQEHHHGYEWHIVPEWQHAECVQ